MKYISSRIQQFILLECFNIFDDYLCPHLPGFLQTECLCRVRRQFQGKHIMDWTCQSQVVQGLVYDRVSLEPEWGGDVDGNWWWFYYFYFFILRFIIHRCVVHMLAMSILLFVGASCHVRRRTSSWLLLGLVGGHTYWTRSSWLSDGINAALVKLRTQVLLFKFFNWCFALYFEAFL